MLHIWLGGPLGSHHFSTKAAPVSSRHMTIGQYGPGCALGVGGSMTDMAVLRKRRILHDLGSWLLNSKLWKVGQPKATCDLSVGFCCSPQSSLTPNSRAQTVEESDSRLLFECSSGTGPN